MAITRTQARAFRARWRRVEGAETAALRRSSMSDRLRMLARLMASVGVIGDVKRLAAEDLAVHRRWSRLRKALGG